jgi:D-xylose transport system permease protein
MGELKVSQDAAGVIIPQSGVDAQAADLSDAFHEKPSRLKAAMEKLGGDGSLVPVSVSLVIVCVIFQLANSAFLSSQNLTNLMLQVSAVGTISIGVVMVLLIGEIDLSVGSMSGVAAAFLAWMSVKNGISPIPAIFLTILVGAAYGALQGLVVTAFRVPAFVITLSSLVALQGVQLILLGQATTISFPPQGAIVDLTTTFFSAGLGLAIAAVGVISYVLAKLRREHKLRRAGLEGTTPHVLVFRALLVAVAFFVPVFVFNAHKGVPLAVFFFVGLVVIFDFVMRRTVFGRRVYAVGGDAEAARRTGIPVKAIKISVFALGSGLAAFGGILAASRLFAATGTQGSGDVLIDAIAAAVIGGTSLFGGRGTVYSALIGTLLIGAISNGMDLLSLSAADKYIVTGMVLAAAVILDAVLRFNFRADEG